MLRVIIAWGIVLNGSVAKHKRLGDFVFLLCLADELPDVLDDIFKIERWFEQDTPPVMPLNLLWALLLLSSGMDFIVEYLLKIYVVGVVKKL